MAKYKLSKNISVFGPEDMDGEDYPAQYQTGHYVLYNKSRDKEYLINETVKYFIDKFLSPKSNAEIIAAVAADLQSDPEHISSTCSTFLRFLRKKRIIIPADQEEVETTGEAFYKEGDLINQYLITGLLSNKRSIDIYTAIDQVTEQKCVVKLLNRNKISREKEYVNEAAYLKREYWLLKRTEGERSICQALDFANDSHGQPFIVLEMIEGEPIFRFVHETPGLSADDVLSVIRNTLQAFASLHLKETVHGDVHSANVLVTPDKSVKLIDLGLSILKKEVEEKQLIKYGGVDFYMPPERINISSVKKFFRRPDFLSDVYQIGLLMYVTLYDDFPFTGFIWEELATAIKEGNVSYPEHSAIGHPVPEGLKQLIGKCMQKDPGKRYKNAAEILDAFMQQVCPAGQLAATNV